MKNNFIFYNIILIIVLIIAIVVPALSICIITCFPHRSLEVYINSKPVFLLLVSITMLTLLAIFYITYSIVRKYTQTAARFNLTIRAAQIGLWTWNSQTDYFTYDEKWAEMNGLKPELGMIKLTEFLKHCDQEDAQTIMQIATTKKESQTEYVISDFSSQLPDGTCRWFKAVGRFEKYTKEGLPWIVSGVSRDITAEKNALTTEIEQRQQLETLVKERTARLEEAIQRANKASQAKSDFLSTISHEIRTPMNAIIGFTHLFDKSNLNTKQLDYINKIYISGKTLLCVINDVLDISKIETGKLELESIPFQLYTIFSSLQSIVGFSAKEKNLEIKIHIPPEVPAIIIGDPTRLNQILLNLLNNAVKFTEKGTITLSVELVKQRQEISELKFKVKDTGIGISETQITKLFKPFAQADSSTTRKYGGTGLGLAICKQLVELMGGTIEVASIENVGTTFSFNIFAPTLTTSTFNTTLPESSSVPSGFSLNNQSFKEMSVLLVEDNDINLEIAFACLEQLGITPDTAQNGKEAVQKILSNQYDLVLMDIQMPIMDGLEATKIIRGHAKQTNNLELLNLPIIAMTANAMLEDKILCLQAGMTSHLAKPFEPIMLEDILRAYVKNIPQRNK